MSTSKGIPDSDHDIVLGCIRQGVRATDIARCLRVNRSTIARVQSGRIKQLKPSLHRQLLMLYLSLRVVK